MCSSASAVRFCFINIELVLNFSLRMKRHHAAAIIKRDETIYKKFVESEIFGKECLTALES